MPCRPLLAEPLLFLCLPVVQGPKAPLRFHDKGRVPMEGAKATGDGGSSVSYVSLSFVDPESTVCIIDQDDHDDHDEHDDTATASTSSSGSPGRSPKGPPLRSPQASRSPSPKKRKKGGGAAAAAPLVPVHCVGLCEDRFGQAWFGAARYIDAATAKARYGLKKLPPDFDRENELLQCLEPEWMPVSRVRGYSYTLCCTRQEFKQRKIEGSLPKGGAAVRFSRYVLSTERGALVGHRSVLGDPYKDGGVIFCHQDSILAGQQPGGSNKRMAAGLARSMTSVSSLAPSALAATANDDDEEQQQETATASGASVAFSSPSSSPHSHHAVFLLPPLS